MSSQKFVFLHAETDEKARQKRNNNNNNNNNYYYYYLFTAIGLSPDGSGYFTCKQNMK